MENFKDYCIIVAFIILGATEFCYILRQLQRILKKKGRRIGFPLYVIAVSLYGIVIVIPCLNNYFAMVDIVNKFVVK